MKKPPKIYLIHAADVAMPPITASFRANWPEARIVNLLEDGLMTGLAEDGRLTDAMIERFVQIGQVLREGVGKCNTVHVLGVRPRDRRVPAAGFDSGVETQRSDVRRAGREGRNC